MLLHKKVHIVFPKKDVELLSEEEKYERGAAEAAANSPSTAKSFILGRWTERGPNETEDKLVGFIASYFTKEEDAADHFYQDIPGYVIKRVRVAERITR